MLVTGIHKLLFNYIQQQALTILKSSNFYYKGHQNNI